MVKRGNTRPGSESRFDAKTVKRIVAEVEEAVESGRGEAAFPRKGRPSLTGLREPSPSVGFRLSPELRRQAEALASERGVSVSALAREALEAYLGRAN